MIPKKIISTFHDRITNVIEVHHVNNSTKESLQNGVDVELDRLREVNGGVIPEEIKKLLDNNNIKY